MNFINKILLESEGQRFKFKMDIPNDVRAIAKVFHDNGYDLFVVGGAVRDAIQGQKIKDYDLATNAIPDTVEDIMKKGGFKTFPKGKSFGVISVVLNGEEYEIGTFRKDIGIGRRPDSVEFSDITTDVQRRDLTMNALFYDINAGEVVDLVGGVQDIKNKKVRTVGQAHERFGEDRLRVLRAIRFAVRMDADVDEAIDVSLRENNSLAGVSANRIHDELFNCIKTAKRPEYLVELLTRYNLFKEIFPGLSVSKIYGVTHDPIVFVATALKTNNTKDLGKSLIKLIYTVNEAKAISFLVNLQYLTEENAVLLKKMEANSHTTKKQIIDFALINKFDFSLIQKFNSFQLSLNGDDVMKQYNVKGAELGALINKLETENFKK